MIKAPRWRRRALFAGGALLLTLGVALCAFELTPLPARLAATDSRLLTFVDGAPAYVSLGSDDRWRLGMGVDEVDPRYLEALLRYEDKRFYSHPGVDALALLRATWQNLSSGRVVSGASTLTMQVVRILEPRPRTLRSKAIEALRALQLEWRLSKREILETYLRFVPLGRNVEGVGAAALAYFGHGVEALSPAEIAVLLAVPQDPNRRYPAAANVDELRAAVDTLAGRLHRQGAFSAGDLEEIERTPVPSQLRPFPRHAPHAAVWLAARRPERARVHTTLSQPVQRKVERILDAYHPLLAEKGIHNGVAVVIDVERAEVVGLVGNLDFWDREHHGQVPGFAALRSPGSALKPFIYGMAIDRGLALPGFLIEDTPVRWGNYAPKNYDEQFRGLVRLEEALALSLNVPFVKLLEQLRVESFLAFLQDHGLGRLRRQAGRFGLSMAIGAVEVSPLELTDLYAALARGGQYRRAALLREDGERPLPDQALSPGAAFLTRRGLRGRDRPDFPARRQYVELAPRVFWKTGTSYGHRDAWALGSNGRYAVGVWLGNFDNTPSRALVGGQRAGPILFDLLDALSNRAFDEAAADLPPPDLVTVEVCASSGHLATEACPHRREALAPAAHTPTARCQLHRLVHVDRDTGHALCPLCRHGRAHDQQVFSVLPTSVRRWVRDQHLLSAAPPEHLPSCQQVVAQAPPELVTPQRGTVLYLIPGLPSDQQEFPAEARVDPRESQVHWFVDGALIKSARPDERVWIEPRPGVMELRVEDSTGRSDVVKVRVRRGGLATRTVKPLPARAELP